MTHIDEPIAPAKRDAITTENIGWWCVWRFGSRFPKIKHETLESARSELERLANENPSKTFIVLESVALARGTIEP